ADIEIAAPALPLQVARVLRDGEVVLDGPARVRRFVDRLGVGVGRAYIQLLAEPPTDGDRSGVVDRVGTVGNDVDGAEPGVRPDRALRQFPARLVEVVAPLQVGALRAGVTDLDHRA